MLMKLATGVNFINILRPLFSYERKLSSFSLITFGFVIFGAKISYEKSACKMLVKLTAGRFSRRRNRIRHQPPLAWSGYRLGLGGETTQGMDR